MEHTGSHKAGLSVRFATVFAALFLQYGFLLPFWPVYLKARGFDAQAIGLFYAVMGCARIATVPLAAFFGERYGQSPRYLTLLAVLAATPYAVFAVTDSFAIDLVLAAAIATFLPALMAILDAKTLAAAQTHGLSYGQARLWGSATFIAVNLGGGILITAFGRDHINWMLCGAALIGAALLMLITRHPWWGEQDTKSTSALSTGLAIVAQAVAAGLSLSLGRALSRGVARDPARFAAAAAAVLFTWSFGHAAMRWLFHGGAMDNGAPNVGLEGFGHALWPLALVLGASALTVRAPRRDEIRPYLYDLQAIWSVAVWPALIFAALGLWVFYAPWWGWARVQVSSASGAVFGVAAPIAAAWMSLASVRVPNVRWVTYLAHAVRIACAGHLLFAITLIVRWSFHQADMNTTVLAQGLELWTYSAVFALFGGGMIALGAVRNDAILNRIGLVILLAGAAKVVIVDTAQLSGLLRAASFLGVGVVSMAVAWATRRIGQKPPPTGPDTNVTPAPRRDRGQGRR